MAAKILIATSEVGPLNIGSMDDEALLERLRLEQSEQFCTLVRMHLSFVLDLNADDCEGYADRKLRPLKWTIGLPFAKKTKSGTKAAEGSHLTLDIVKQMTLLIDFLTRKENITQEGIFRRTGKLKRQQELKTKLMNGEPIDLTIEAYSVHDCASVLKTILAELPEPLLTESQYPAYCQVAELRGNEDRLLLAVQLLTLLLPLENRAFFRQLMSLLNTISQHEEQNRMSAANLATLFTPHLICPRRLAPEVLHEHSQLLSRVVAFMIESSEQIFQVPDTLATDVRAYWEKKERRRRSPLRQLNESICDGTTVSTVFTFVDRERTAQENGSNPTELALAQLYAHIQSLPDSAMKRRLVKNFNKKNGQGTPAVGSEERNKHRRTRSLKDSIKKHLSGFSKNGKTSEGSPSHDTSGKSPDPLKTPRLTNSSKQRTRPPLKEELLKLSRTPSKENMAHLANISRSKSCDALNNSIVAEEPPSKTRSTAKSPDCRSLKRSIPVSSQSRPISQTIRHGAKASSIKKQSPPAPSLVLPTKRPSPVKLSSAKSPQSLSVSSRARKRLTPPLVSNEKNVLRLTSQWGCETQDVGTKEQSGSAVRKRLSPEAICCPQPAKRQSPDFPPPATVTPFSVSSLRMFEHGLPCPTPTNRISYVSTPQCRRLGTLTTSTPACVLTSQVERNSSMSPITRSAQRMPRAMQETMMTPRSRKPVVSLSGTDLCHLSGLEHWSPGEVGNKLILEESENSDPLRDEKADSSLSTTFRDYLYSRSALTASPVDLSFSSRTDDFQSCSGSAKTSLEDLPSLEGQMSQSLLFCLDGNNPDENDCSGRERSLHVCETAI